MKLNKISIIGGSGHAKVVIDIAEELGYTIENVYDHDIKKERLFSHKILHDFDKLPKKTVIAIGNNDIRKKIAEEYALSSPSLVHPSSCISKHTLVGEGTVVMPGVTINVDTVIGKHCIINTNSSIDHDCLLNDYVHISPNVSLAGNVEIGSCTHIGIGACVIQGIKIGRNCVVGAGAVVIKDISDGKTVVGNPARELNKIKK